MHKWLVCSQYAIKPRNEITQTHTNKKREKKKERMVPYQNKNDNKITLNGNIRHIAYNDTWWHMLHFRS